MNEIDSNDVFAPRRRPVYGILAQSATSELENQYGDQVVNTSVVRYIQMGGSLVVPVWLEQSDEYYSNIMQRINGLVFPGAWTHDAMNSPYAKAAHKLMKLAIELNDSGVYFPIVGFCAGLEVFVTYVTGRDVLKQVNVKPYLYGKLENKHSEHAIGQSRFFGHLTKSTLKLMYEKPTMLLIHSLGLLLEDYLKEPDLVDFFDVLSTVEKDNKTIVTTIEAKNYPFYGAQWHPDKLSFWHNTRFSHVPWYPCNTVIGQEFSNFFTAEALKNDQHYKTLDEETQALIDNHASSTTLFQPHREIGHIIPRDKIDDKPRDQPNGDIGHIIPRISTS